MESAKVRRRCSSGGCKLVFLPLPLAISTPKSRSGLAISTGPAQYIDNRKEKAKRSSKRQSGFTAGDCCNAIRSCSYQGFIPGDGQD